MPLPIGIREAASIRERIGHLQLGQALVAAQVGVLRMVLELLRREFQRAEGGLDEIEAGVGRVLYPLLARGRGHAEREDTPKSLRLPIWRE